MPRRPAGRREGGGRPPDGRLPAQPVDGRLPCGRPRCPGAHATRANRCRRGRWLWACPPCRRAPTGGSPLRRAAGGRAGPPGRAGSSGPPDEFRGPELLEFVLEHLMPLRSETRSVRSSLSCDASTFVSQGGRPHRESSASSDGEGALETAGGASDGRKVLTPAQGPSDVVGDSAPGQGAEGRPSRTSVYLRTARSSPRTPSATPAQETDLIQAACGLPGAPNAGRTRAATPTISPRSAKRPAQSAVVARRRRRPP